MGKNRPVSPKPLVPPLIILRAGSRSSLGQIGDSETLEDGAIDEALVECYWATREPSFLILGSCLYFPPFPPSCFCPLTRASALAARMRGHCLSYLFSFFFPSPSFSFLPSHTVQSRLDQEPTWWPENATAIAIPAIGPASHFPGRVARGHSAATRTPSRNAKPSPALPAGHSLLLYLQYGRINNRRSLNT